MDEEYNWDDFDAQSNEYLNSDAYNGESFSTPDGMSWGGNGANISNWTGYNGVPSIGQSVFDTSSLGDMWGTGQLWIFSRSRIAYFSVYARTIWSIYFV